VERADRFRYLTPHIYFPEKYVGEFGVTVYDRGDKFTHVHPAVRAFGFYLTYDLKVKRNLRFKYAYGRTEQLSPTIGARDDDLLHEVLSSYLSDKKQGELYTISLIISS
jgi:hypothetical protein